jgi:hypothetical protein
MHPVVLKRQVEGRSTSYDILYQEHINKYNSSKKSIIILYLDVQKDIPVVATNPEVFTREEDMMGLLSKIQCYKPRPAAQAHKFSISEWNGVNSHQAILDILKI